MNERLQGWKTALPFIAIFLIVVTIQYMYLLKAEQHSNTMPWSRSVDLQLKADNRSPLISTDNEEIKLFSARTGKIDQSLVKNDLSVINLDEIKVPIDPQDSFWTNGIDVLYLHDDTLYYQNETIQKKKIFESVNLMSVNEGLVIVSQEQGIYSINLTTFTPEKIVELTKPAEDIIITLDPNNFVTAIPFGAGILSFSLYQLNQSVWEEIDLFQYDTKAAMYTGLDYLVVGDSIKAILTATSRKGGGNLTYINQYTEMSLSKPTEKVFTNLKLTDLQTKNRLNLIKGFNIFQENGITRLLFSSESSLNDIDSFHIFMAEQVNGIWEADRISTSLAASSKPIWVNSSFITWLDYDPGTRKNLIMGASTNPEAVAESLQLTKNDFIYALSRTLLSLSGALVFLLVSLLVLLPTVIILIGMNVFTIYNKTRIKWLAVGSYFITQLFFIQRFFDASTIQSGPFFINFSYSQYLLPIITGILTLICFKFVRNSEWSEEGEVMYISLLHMFMLVIMVGPYVL